MLALLAMVDGFAFDVEMLFLARRLGLIVRPLVVTWEDVAGSSVRPGRDALEMLRDIRGVRAHALREPRRRAAPTSISLEDVVAARPQARLHGLVLARGDEDALLVLGRDDAPGRARRRRRRSAGTLRTARIDELRGRRFEAV